MSQGSSQKKPKAVNQRSRLLSHDENNKLFQLVGGRCVSLASAVVQIFCAKPPHFNSWVKRCCGVCCFVKDNPKRSYYIRCFDIKTGSLLYEQELYDNFSYNAPRGYFHTFEGEDCPVGINFANEDEAEFFNNALNNKLDARRKRKSAISDRRRNTTRNTAGSGSQNTTAKPAIGISQPSLPSVPANAGKDTLKKKKDKGKKVKISKEDIGTPTNFRHVGHVGWDPDKGFDMNNLDPSLKRLFDQVGITESELNDKDTANFIYEFIDKHGGLEAVKKDAERPPAPFPVSPAPQSRPPPPPPTSVHPPTARRQQPPPPPQRREAPPAPPTGAIMPPAAPPHARSVSSRPPLPTRGPLPPQPPPHATSSHLGAPPLPPPTVSPPAPPPMAPPSAPLVSAPPNAPPPPPMMAGGANPPPPPAPAMTSAGDDGRGDLLKAIRTGTSLKPVEQQAAAPVDERGMLLEQIRGGAKLKHVSAAAGDKKDDVSEQSDGMAAALQRALMQRNMKISGDDDEEENEIDDDEDWDD